MSSDPLITFRAITNFTKELAETFGTKQRSLKLYEHLIKKTTLEHTKAIDTHVKSFQDFCIKNRDAIISKDHKKLVNKKVNYSERVFIDFEQIFNTSDKETKNIIWQHLLHISALVDPAGEAKKILQNTTTGQEADFLTDIISKVEEHVDPNANPMEAVSSIMQSGVFAELIGGMNNGLQNGSLDLSKLMASVQNMVKGLNDQADDQEGGDEAMNMINTMMGNMINQNKNNEIGESSNSQQMPDLAGMMGPMLSALGSGGGIPDLTGMMNGGNKMTIQEKIDAEIEIAKKSGKL